jgi:hypothetical protein
MMRDDFLRDNWLKLSKDVAAAFPELTPAELEQINGITPFLVAQVAGRRGIPTEEARAVVDDFVAQVRVKYGEPAEPPADGTGDGNDYATPGG